MQLFKYYLSTDTCSKYVYIRKQLNVSGILFFMANIPCDLKYAW